MRIACLYRDIVQGKLLFAFIAMMCASIFVPLATHAITDGSNAIDLVGQFDETDFTTPVPVFTKPGANNAANTFGFNNPSGVAVDPIAHILFTADYANNRILAFNLSPTNTLTDRVPDAVFGQPNFATNDANTTRTGLNGPVDLAIDVTTKRLFVSDEGNNRVLTYYYTFNNGQNAIDLLGQYDQVSMDAPFPVYTKIAANDVPNRLGLSAPNDVSLDSVNNRLFVLDASNNRVLVYAMNANGTFVDRIPDNVLGTTNFYTSISSPTQATFFTPRALAFDSINNRLFVSQNNVNRVTVYDTTSITDGENATNILGQSSYTASAAATTQNGLNIPWGIALDEVNSRLYVTQQTGNRVSVFDVDSIVDGENAVDLIGQYDQSSVSDPVPLYTKATVNDGPNRLGMSAPAFAAYDTTNDRLFVTDGNNGRVLVYAMNSDGTFVDRIPDNILGQSNYYTTTVAVQQNGMSGVRGLAYDSVNNRLFVAQQTANRVTVYDVASITDGENATNVLGQTSYVTSLAATTQPGMNVPQDLVYNSASNSLFVAQSTGNRVTVYDVAAITDGENATNLLGQTSYTVATAATTQNGLNAPSSITFDSSGNRLFVAQSTGNRVTVYDVAAITNGENATNVLGQTTFTAATAATTQPGMNAPVGLAYDGTGNRLFVAQSTGNRVTVYDVAAITNGENATNVLGQPNYTTTTAATTQNGVNIVQGIAYDSVNNRLFVTQSTSNRVTVYDVAAITNGENAVDLIGHYDQTSMSAPVPLYTSAIANDVPYRLGMSAPSFIEYDGVNNRLFVSEQSNHRILVYAMNSDGTFVDRIPDNVIGQPNYYTVAAANTQPGLSSPQGIAFDTANNRLFVVGSSANRVTVYDTAAITDGENAANVLGQTSFTTTTAVANQVSMGTPIGIEHDSANNRLFVVNNGYNRITVYDTAAITNGENAVDMIGHYDQTSLTNPVPLYSTSIANDVPYKLGLSGPSYVEPDSVNNRLFVSDTQNHRVLVYALNPDGTFVDRIPDNLIGQPNYYTRTQTTTQNGMNTPTGLAYDSANNRLFVGQSAIHRVTVYDVSAITDGENASNVLGQSSYTSSSVAVTQSTMTGTQGVVYDSTNNKLYVAEATNNRVTVYDTTVITTGENAIDVIGQHNETDLASPVPIFTKGTAHDAPNRSGYSSPSSVALDGTNNRLFISDAVNQRILVYAMNSDGTFVDRIPDNVIGQPNYYTSSAVVSQSGLSSPIGLAFDPTGNRLFVANQASHRVTVYDTAAITDGENAANVLGQSTFTAGSVSMTQNSLATPTGLAYDDANSRLFVSQNSNTNRITVFDVASITNGENATNLIGQALYTSTIGGPQQNNLSTPLGIAYDSVNNRLFIADSASNRVVVYPTASIPIGQNSTNVLGQINYSPGSVNAATTQPGMNVPQAVAYDSANSRLFVSQSTGNRVTVYDVAAITDGENATNVLGQTSFAIATGAITQNGMSTPIGLAYDSTNNRLFVVQNGAHRLSVYDTAAITNGENAVDLAGQHEWGNVLAPAPFYTKGVAHDAVNRFGLSTPTHLALDAGSRLFVGDQANNRVLVYPLNPDGTFVNRLPSNILGQSNYAASTAATTQNGINVPQGIAYDPVSSRLFVAQATAHRITIYDTAAITDGENAANILGQTSYTVATAGSTQNGLNGAAGIAYDRLSGRLFVTQTTSNRVSVFATPTLSSGQNAAGIIGQPDFTTSAAATTQNGLNVPQGIAHDSTGDRLFIAQRAANRVSVFNLARPSQNATNVLGQPTFTSTTANTTQNGLNVPQGIAYDPLGSRLFVAQGAANRITIFDVASITPGQNSTNVIGQPDFTGGVAATTVNGMNSPLGLSYDTGLGTLFIADTANNRVISQNVKVLSNGQNALDLLGQYDMTDLSDPLPYYTKIGNHNSPGPMGFSTPTHLAYDATNNRLFVGDQSNNRVLVYAMNSNGTFVDRLPDNVLGQPHFYVNTLAVSQNGLSAPIGIAYDETNNRLFVVNSNNNRVTVYDVTDITDGENATNLLGQTSYTVATAATTQNGMNTPYGLAYDSTNSRLFVGQSAGNRVTVYDIAAITDGENATNVLGQPTYISLTAATTQNGLNTPVSLAYDATNSRLFVAQSTGNRVTVYNVAAITDGENATNLLGQTSYTALTGATTQNGLNGPFGVGYDSTNNRLFVGQTTAHRVTVYDTAAITDGENATNILGQPNFVTATANFTQNGASGPYAFAYHSASNRLFVTQGSANRIVVYDVAAITNGENAVDLLGQSDGVNLSTPTPVYTKGGADDSPNRYGFLAPNAIAHDSTNNRMFLVDSINHRVLVYAMNGDGTFVDRIPDNVLGQPDFVTGATATTQNGFNSPQAVAFDETNNRLFVAQSGSQRVTVYDVAAITNGENATNVLGQPTFVTTTAATTQNGMSSPQGLAYDSVNNRLLVSQAGNHRITIYDTAAITNGENAVDLLGQYDESSFTAPVPLYTKTLANNGPNTMGFNSPAAVEYDAVNNRLFLIDQSNSRVLVYAMNANGTFVDRVPDNILGVSNYYTILAGNSQNALNLPMGLAYDSANNRLFVSQFNANRVTVYDVAAITDGENATNVLGQTTFAGSSSATTQSGMSGPNGLTYDGANNRLFVSQQTSNRVTVYDVAAITNGENATSVLGQTTFTATTAATTQNGLNLPIGMAYDSPNNRLFVTNISGNRVTVYDVASITNGENAVNLLGQTSYTVATAAVTQPGMSSPVSAVYDSANSRLFVGQTRANRVTVYDVASITDGENATNLLGQTAYTASTAVVAQNGISAAQSLAFDSANNRLFVVNSGSNRMTVYDTAAITDGENAVDLLGQYDQEVISTPVPAYVKNTANDGPNRYGFNSPRYLLVDNTNNRLFVDDQFNARVLVYDMNSDGTFPDRIPDNVLGKANFYTSTVAVTQNTFSSPSGLAYDSVLDRLFVADQSAHRVLIFDTAAIANGENAINILGQTVYSAGSLSNTSNGMNAPQGLAYDSANSRLHVTQSTGNRVSVFKLSFQNGQNATAVLGQPNFTTATAATTQNGMNGPVNVALDNLNSNLFTVDKNNNRLTIYGVTPLLNGENALDLLGQYDQTSFTNPVPVFIKSGADDGPNKFGFSGATFMTVDTNNHRMFISDSSNNRILVYKLNNDNTFADRVPDNVLGQSNYYSRGTAATQNGINAPRGLSYDNANTRLFVSDGGNNRVLVYDVSAITDGENATNVLGQATFTAATSGNSQTTMNTPRGLVYDGTANRLFVADNQNNRVLRYDVTAIQNGENASGVLGQPNFTSTTPATTQNGMNGPQGVVYHGGQNRLFVAQNGSNRVTTYSVGFFANGMNAANVLGQTTYTGSSSANTQAGMNDPRDLAYDDATDRLFVAQNGNNRVTVYDAAAITNGESAISVLGQATYTATAPAATQSGLNGPIGLAFEPVNNALFISDSVNNRLLMFDGTSGGGNNTPVIDQSQFQFIGF